MPPGCVRPGYMGVLALDGPQRMRGTHQSRYARACACACLVPTALRVLDVLGVCVFVICTHARLQAGNYVPDEVASNLVALIASTPELQAYSVQKMYMALANEGNHVSIVHSMSAADPYVREWNGRRREVQQQCE